MQPTLQRELLTELSQRGFHAPHSGFQGRQSGCGVRSVRTQAPEIILYKILNLPCSILPSGSLTGEEGIARARPVE